MIYICADDYGLSKSSTEQIQKCIEKGALDKVSIFPNFEEIDLNKILINENIRVSLHLNLVEGKCMSEKAELDLIADKNGNFKHTFAGLLKLNLYHSKKLEAQLYKEIRAQVLFWKGILPQNAPFCIDSHQHTHMIPAVFNTLINVLNDEGINISYMRIPAEPILPYLTTPSLYFTYKPLNIIKQWLLNFLWSVNKKRTKKLNLHTSHFFGILFSGKMDEKRVGRVLEKYKKLAEKDGKDIEVLFHPGYMNGNGYDLKSQNIVFDRFYLSPDRKTEFDSVMKISERSVH